MRGIRCTIWVRVVVIIQSSGTTLRAVVVSVIRLRLFNIIIVIVPRVKRVVHVGGRGWRRVTLIAARRIMTGRHSEREEKEGGRRARKMPGVVVVVQGTPALNVTRPRGGCPCGRAGALLARLGRTHSSAVAACPSGARLSNHQPRPIELILV